MGRISLNAIQSDGKITEKEVRTKRMWEIGQTLEKWGKVRASSGATGANPFVEIAGLGRFQYSLTDSASEEQTRQALIDALRDKFTFPIRKTDTETVASTEPIESDRRRVQFGANPEDVASDIQQEAEQVAAGSNSQTNSGASTGLLAALAGAVVLAVAVLGGN